jgi:hypothetical protein
MEATIEARSRWVVLAHPGHDQKSHGRKGSGGGATVRDSLANAKDVKAIGAAARAEAKRITGRDIEFDFEGSDPQIAREHAEGVLRGLERFPDAPLAAVRMFTPPMGVDGDIANAGPDRTAAEPFKSYSIEFNTEYSGNPTYYQNTLDAQVSTGYFRQGADNPTYVALHEFGHVAIDGRGARRDVYDRAVEHADAAGRAPREHFADALGRRAAESIAEFGADAFADVMQNGADAAPLSTAAFSVVEAAYR